GDKSSTMPLEDHTRKATRPPSVRTRYSPSLRITVCVPVIVAGRIQPSSESALVALSADDDGTRTEPAPASPALVSGSPASAPACPSDTPPASVPLRPATRSHAVVPDR